MFTRNEIRTLRVARKRRPWTELEEFTPDGGMWASPPRPDWEALARAAEELMADPPAFIDAMRRAPVAWPNSCEENLGNTALNLRAWLGHAGCFLAVGSPEETTRLGWHALDTIEQRAANAAADQVIAEWRSQRGGQVRFDLA